MNLRGENPIMSSSLQMEHKWFSFSLLPEGGEEINRKSTFQGL